MVTLRQIMIYLWEGGRFGVGQKRREKGGWGGAPVKRLVCGGSCMFDCYRFFVVVIVVVVVCLEAVCAQQFVHRKCLFETLKEQEEGIEENTEQMRCVVKDKRKSKFRGNWTASHET